MREKARVNQQQGQTLIEVIIAIGLVVLVLITLVSALTLGVRNNRYARDQSTAKNYVRQATEWTRALREQMGWAAFLQMVNQDSSPATYCLVNLPTSVNEAVALSNSSCGTTTYIPTTIFGRELTLTVDSATQITAKVVVKWKDGNKNYSSESTLIMRERL